MYPLSAVLIAGNISSLKNGFSINPDEIFQ